VLLTNPYPWSRPDHPGASRVPVRMPGPSTAINVRLVDPNSIDISNTSNG
jgi:hypothetical protein